MRGRLLWIVIPLGDCAWASAAPWLRRRVVGLGYFLGWVDLTLIAFLTRMIVRPCSALALAGIHGVGVSGLDLA